MADPPDPAAKRVRKNRYGMTVGEREVDALLALFRTADRGGDLRILLRAEALLRFRASLQRIKDGTRMKFGGRQRKADARAEEELEDELERAEDEEIEDAFQSPLPCEDREGWTE